MTCDSTWVEGNWLATGFDLKENDYRLDLKVDDLKLKTWLEKVTWLQLCMYLYSGYHNEGYWISKPNLSFQQLHCYFSVNNIVIHESKLTFIVWNVCDHTLLWPVAVLVYYRKWNQINNCCYILMIKIHTQKDQWSEYLRYFWTNFIFRCHAVQ